MEPGRDMPSDLESKKKELFRYAMKGKWSRVIAIYEEDARVHDAKITRSGDTGLHIAVSEGKEEEVAQMVDSIRKLQPDPKKALKTKNERGNIALHTAASMGNVKMCEKIASAESSLVDCRNDDGETPLFLAVLYGKKEAFLCLHYLRHPDTTVLNYVNCRRNNGDTILHCAINGDHFDLAFQIFHLYEDLVTSVNQDGLSPLHLLAAKHTAFRSGCRLGRTETIIYHCLFVDKLKVADRWRSRTANKDGQAIHPYIPDNYNILWDVYSAIRSAITAGKDEEESRANTKDPEKAKNNQDAARGSDDESQGRTHSFPANYRTCYHFLKFLYLMVLVILGQGSTKLNKMRRKKQKHIWSVQIMNALLVRASHYEYEDNGTNPDTPNAEEITSILAKKEPKKRKRETPILIAAKNGVMEMVREILILFPVAIYDENEEKKNIVLLAVEKRQPHVYKLLLQKNFYKESIFRQVDNEGNSALHLAAKLGPHKPWRISGAALQMQWEIKWYEFVKNSMPPHFFFHYNKKFQTPRDIFTETHSELVQSGGEWLTKTSESCSVVATLVATVAFASSTTVPGGTGDRGRPILENEPAFDLFAISSLVAVCFSICSTVMFLSILTSRYQEFDFNKDLPRKLILGMSSLFLSIAFMLVSFCAGHYYVLKDQLHYVALPIYLVTSFPVTLFALAQFPLYFDLLKATFKNVPQRSYKATPAMIDYVPSETDKKNGKEE